MSHDPCTPVTLTSPDGATLTVCAYGGQVLGWSPQPGQERLWLSPARVCGQGQAIRGGVPVIFPQFSGRGPLPKHGLARDRPWVAQEVPDPQAALWRARLTSDDSTLAIWPHAFQLDLQARATAAALELTLQVTNTDTQPWTFAAALHTYLTVQDDAAALTGLTGHAVEQNSEPGVVVQHGQTGQGNAAPWLALESRDVRVLDVSGPVILEQRSGALTLHATGFPDRVAWNPGPGHGLSDVPAGAERSFVCCEPAVVTPIELQGGQSWTGRQLLSV
jgi:glucose-6-phosphate 1-epimerase